METSFGNWIKRRRKALDITQEELGQRVGCSTSAIFKIEADERRPSRQLAELLAECLEIPENQRGLFLKIARQEKGTSSLEEVAPMPVFSPNAAPVQPTSVQRPSRLPVFPTRFVGRAHEIEIVVRQMDDPACRLLTLTGPGGVGKTRLAVEVARRLESSFGDGVYFLPMAPVMHPEAIVPALADALGIVFSGPADPQVQVIHTLGRKKILLVLDNMEHLVAGSDIFGEILQQAPNVKLLLTSREQVHLQWEWIFEVQGLPVPEEASADVLETNSAVLLFLQRASQASQSAPLSSEEAAALVRICKLVDGLPLAIELAASWVRVMTYPEIAQELEDNLGLLETSLYDMPARHRSIKMVFDHSWALLTEQERTVLMRLSVFSGGFPRKAAEAVAGASLPLLSSLVSKSLLRYSKQEARYDFHELIRQYARAERKAASEEEQRTLEKHSQYFAQWLATLESPLKSHQQPQTSAQIRSESANWTTAWQWAVQSRRLDLLRRMLPCMFWYYEIHGYYQEALTALRYAERELRAAGAPGTFSTPAEQSAFAFIIDMLAWFTFRMGDFEQAARLFTESLRLVEPHQDQEVLYYINGNWSYMALQSGNMEQAQALAAASLANGQALDSQWHIAIPTNVLGSIELHRGNLREAYRQLTASLALWRTVGDPRGIVFCMLYLGSAAFALGDIQAAEEVLRESSQIAEGKMDHWAQAVSLDLLGQVLMSKSQVEDARDMHLQSLRLSEEIGDQWGSTQALIHLGEAKAALGQAGEAKGLFLRAYFSAQQARWTPTILEALVAYLSVDEDSPPEDRLAVALSILAHPACLPAVQQRAERLCERLSPLMGAAQIEAAQARAAAIDPERWELPA